VDARSADDKIFLKIKKNKIKKTFTDQVPKFMRYKAITIKISHLLYD
jgi:hypothetical protein